MQLQLEGCNWGSDKLIAPTSQFVIPTEDTYSGLGTAMLVKSKRCKVRRCEIFAEFVLGQILGEEFHLRRNYEQNEHS